jgi:hypothetical protein
MSISASRNLNINVNVDALKFDTMQKQDAFHQALGRMVAYALAMEDGKSDFVSLSINKGDAAPEITAAYYRAVSYGPQRYIGTDYGKHQDAVKVLANLHHGLGTAFVMGGIPREGGTTYSFHS